MKNLFLSIIVLFSVLSANASMNWTAVAVPEKDIDRLVTNEDALAKAMFETRGEQNISLDKAWHGIHFLLTGSAWEVKGGASLAILGGKPVGEDLGYGPARVLTPVQVKQIAAALERETPESLSVRYKPQVMEKAQIYPAIWKSGVARGFVICSIATSR